MKIFAIRDENKGEENLAYLIYYEASKKFFIEISEDRDEWQVPILLSSFVKRKQYTIGARLSKLWVQQRIVPADRQNLGQILRDNKLKSYDEFKLLMLADGRCAQDDYYLLEVNKDNMPEFIVKRFQMRVCDVLPLKNLNVLVFFNNGITKRCNLEHLMKDRIYAPVRTNQKLFNSVSLEAGGYGICWGENLVVDAEDLYEVGIDVPLNLDDICGFFDRRIVNVNEVAKMLACSRQNVDAMVKKEKLKPVKISAQNRLFLKSDVEHLDWK